MSIEIPELKAISHKLDRILALLESDYSKEEYREPRTLMDAKSVTTYLRISEPTLYRLMEREAFPYFKVGRRLLFRPENIDTWLETNRA